MEHHEERKPLTVTDFKELLPPNVAILPHTELEELVGNSEIIRGLIESNASYAQALEATRATVEQSGKLYESSIHLFEKYNSLSAKIESRIRDVQEQHSEFLAIQVAQHQLLLTFSPEFALHKKYEKWVNESNAQSISLAGSLKFPQGESSEDDAQWGELLAQFIQARKLFHERQEKLYRWNEERVTGLV